MSRVLVVDDEGDLLITYERLLRRQGYDVITATTRAAGLAAVRASGAAPLVPTVNDNAAKSKAAAKPASSTR